MTLAGRRGDRTEAERRIHAAWTAAEEFPTDLLLQGERFGPANTATHVLATEGDLGRPREVIQLAEQLAGNDTGLPPTRLVDVHTNTARAQVDLDDRDGAQTSLVTAFAVAPQKAKVHPISLEVLRVLLSLHGAASPSSLRSPDKRD
ncbi:MAG: hypothetical protein ACRDR6_00760 [Pseudonocardiaceae bacterium]